MTDPTEEYKEVKFPFAGIDRQGGFDQQPNKPVPVDGSYARTTYLGKNVRAVDATTDRVRGASRPGTAKYVSATVSGSAGYPVQPVNMIVDPQTPATLGSYTGDTGIIGGVPGVTSGESDPSTNNRFDDGGDPLDRRNPGGGRTVPPGGSGVPLVRNRPQADPDTDGSLLVVNLLGADFAGVGEAFHRELADRVSDLTAGWTVLAPAGQIAAVTGGDQPSAQFEGLPVSTFSEAVTSAGLTETFGATSGPVAGSRRVGVAGYGVGTTYPYRIKVLAGKVPEDPAGQLGHFNTDSRSRQESGSAVTHAFNAGTNGQTYTLADGGNFTTYSCFWLDSQLDHRAAGYTAAVAQSGEFHCLWLVYFPSQTAADTLAARFPACTPEAFAARISSRITVRRVINASESAAQESMKDEFESWFRAIVT